VIEYSGLILVTLYVFILCRARTVSIITVYSVSFAAFLVNCVDCICCLLVLGLHLFCYCVLKVLRFTNKVINFIRYLTRWKSERKEEKKRTKKEVENSIFDKICCHCK